MDMRPANAIKKILALLYIAEYFLRSSIKSGENLSRSYIQRCMKVFDLRDYDLDLLSKITMLSSGQKKYLEELCDSKTDIFNEQFSGFVESNFKLPCPNTIKWKTLLRHAPEDCIWIETGTHIALTTEVLAKNGGTVFSIEPSKHFFELAKSKFENNQQVKILHGLSEDILPDLLPQLSGNIAFWLDGHYSAGNTFKGPKDTPIIEELDTILKNKSHFMDITVLVDDVRCFNPSIDEYSSYPDLNFLVNWANKNQFNWSIEYDIFIAKNF
jgi:hypothetical protein